jgi:DNA-binding PadR family transcriptional regulator
MQGKWWGWGFHHGSSGSFGPWGYRNRFFESGEVRLAILSLLDEGPKHGYELIKELEARSGGLYRASAGTVYPTLQLLEDEGLIESERQDGKRVYHITAAGQAELTGETDTVRGIWDRAAHWEDWSKWMGPEAALIAAPLARLVKAAFRAVTRAADDPSRGERIREVLEKARRDLEKLAGSHPAGEEKQGG